MGPDSDCLANLEQLYEHLSDKDKLSFLRFAYPDYDTTLTDKQCLATLETTFGSEDSNTEFELLAEGCVTYSEPSADAHSGDDMAPSVFVVDKDDAPSKDDVKAEKATKASSKATTANKTEKGEKADELKSEKATKANSKATLASKTEKGEKADNIKASHSGTTVSSSAAFSAFYGGGSSYVVEKDEAKSKADVKNMKSTKASSKATVASKTAKGSKADDLKSKKTTKATSKADNIKASHSVSFMRLYKMDECSICDDTMPDSDCLANLEQLYEHLSDKDKLSFLRFAYPDY